MPHQGDAGNERNELVRLRDELEQFRTSFEAASDEVSRLTDDRHRLLQRLASQARALQLANKLYTDGVAGNRNSEDSTELSFRLEQDQEELRVAFEEMQVLTEEL